MIGRLTVLLLMPLHHCPLSCQPIWLMHSHAVNTNLFYLYRRTTFYHRSNIFFEWFVLAAKPCRCTILHNPLNPVWLPFLQRAGKSTLVANQVRQSSQLC